MTPEIRTLLEDCADMLDHLKQIATFEDEAEADALIARIGEAMKQKAPPASQAAIDMMGMANAINRVFMSGLNAGGPK